MSLDKRDPGSFGECPGRGIGQHKGFQNGNEFKYLGDNER